MDNFASRANANTLPLVALTRSAYRSWLKGQSKTTQAWLKASGFSADSGEIALVPKRDGSVAKALLGLGKAKGDVIWPYASAVRKLPKGRYALDPAPSADAGYWAALGWALGTYRFERYKSKPAKKLPSLVWPDEVDRKAVERAFAATALARDLVNTPAADLGPAELAEAALAVADSHGAEVEITVGEQLVADNYPAVYAVGKGCPREPRLIDMRWGDEDAPRVSLVGKGVVFDSGGLDLKSAAGMKLMKKDMGGAASVLALAQMIMAAELPVRLRVLIPAVENAISGSAFHPLDVLQTRKGKTVEVGNTDAEGRLILCDALAEADSENPDVLIDFATLTGAARVALGTELPALFCNDDELAAEILASGDARNDPLWRMPLFRSYRRHLDSRIADINNIANVSQGGAITAALFLNEFVSDRTSWVHVDTMAYNLHTRPGRPIGGEAFGVRAMFDVLRRRYQA